MRSIRLVRLRDAELLTLTVIVMQSVKSSFKIMFFIVMQSFICTSLSFIVMQRFVMQSLICTSLSFIVRQRFILCSVRHCDADLCALL